MQTSRKLALLAFWLLVGNLTTAGGMLAFKCPIDRLQFPQQCTSYHAVHIAVCLLGCQQSTCLLLWSNLLEDDPKQAALTPAFVKVLYRENSSWSC